MEFNITEVPYYINSTGWTIQDIGSLTVAGGVMIKIIQDARVSAYGPVYINGTSTDPVVITSYNDSRVWDTNGSGTVGTPGTAGYWKLIDLMASGCTISYCTFNYGITPIDINDWNYSQGSVVIDNCTFQYNSYGGIDATEALSGTVISNSTFSDNGTTTAGIYDIDINGNTNVVYDTGNDYEVINP